MVFGVLVVEDIVGILLLVLLPTIALGNTIDGKELALSTLKLVFFLVLCFVIGIYIVPTFLKKITGFLTDEMLLLITISMVFQAWFCSPPRQVFPLLSAPLSWLNSGRNRNH